MEVMFIMQDSKSGTLLNNIIIATSLAIFVATTLNFFLPSYGVDKQAEAPYHDFHIYKIAKLFVDNKKKEKPKPVEKPKVKEKVYDLKKWKLIATYLSDSDGFVMLKDGKKTKIVYLDYSYKGYELVEVKDSEAIFKSRRKLFSLKLDEVKKKKRKGKRTKDEADRIIENELIEQNIQVKSKIDPETNEISSAEIKRKDINFYMKNVGQIWKNIRIKDYRENRRLRGFKVTYVKKGSAFYNLGLKAGDIITAINGEEIRSYSQVQKFYKNINRIRQLNLTISRNGEERDIEYDIN
jgi:general secretion pathway protein C